MLAGTQEGVLALLGLRTSLVNRGLPAGRQHVSGLGCLRQGLSYRSQRVRHGTLTPGVHRQPRGSPGSCPYSPSRMRSLSSTSANVPAEIVPKRRTNRSVVTERT